MKARLVRVGNSHGVRIPKAVIEQCGFKDEVELTIKDDLLIIAPARGLRAGWDEAFQAMAAAGDDAPLLPDDADSTWDREEWDW